MKVVADTVGVWLSGWIFLLEDPCHVLSGTVKVQPGDSIMGLHETAPAASPQQDQSVGIPDGIKPPTPTRNPCPTPLSPAPLTIEWVTRTPFFL